MAEHPSVSTMTRYRAGTLPPAELLAVDDHLASCAACRQGAAGTGAFDQLRGAVSSTAAEHVAFETLERYVDGALDEADRQIVDAHLADCVVCAEDAADLRQARADVFEAGRAHAAGTRPAINVFTGWRAGVAAAAGLAAAAGIAFLLVPRAPGEIAPANGTPVPVTSTAAVNPPAVTMRDGQFTITIDAEGRIAGLPELPPADREAVTLALASGQARVENIAGIAGRAGTLMGSGAQDGTRLTPLSPVGTAVETDRPSFTWTAQSGATAYVVTVFDGDFNEVARSPELTAREWTVASPLKRGAVYAWQVSAQTPSGIVVAPAPPAPEARFRIVDAETAGILGRAKATYAGSHLTLGVVYARAGVRDDAERELRAFQEANPGSPLAASLLRSVTTSAEGK